MKKVTLEVDVSFKPLDGSILVYNAKKGVWEIASKTYILARQDEKIATLEKDIENQERNNNEFMKRVDARIKELATLIKQLYGEKKLWWKQLFYL